MEEPGEEWTCTERVNICIGTDNVSMTSLLDGNNELSNCVSMTITDGTVCAQFQPADVKGTTTTTTDDGITEVQWSMKCNCVLRKVQTVGDMKILTS